MRTPLGLPIDGDGFQAQALGHFRHSTGEACLEVRGQEGGKDQAAFRLDFPAWVPAFSERDRKLLERILRGERTVDLADRFGMSPARQPETAGVRSVMARRHGLGRPRPPGRGFLARRGSGMLAA